VLSTAPKPNHYLKIFYQQLDGLRALSVFAVILAHGVPFVFFRNVLAPGFWGVNLFFVLSGFLITEILLKQIHAGKKPREILKSFFIKRSLRIFPVYYFVLILALGFNLDGCRNYSGFVFTYTLNIYNAATGMEGRYLSHIWSLCVEEQFYLLWPFLLLAVKPAFHKYLILMVIGLAVAFRWIVATAHYHNFAMADYRFMPSALDALGTGAVLAYLKLFCLPLLKRMLRYSLIPIVFALLFFGLSFFSYPYKILLTETLLRLCVSVCCFFIIGIAVFGYKGRFGRLLENPLLRYLGKISYGIYLFHLIIQYFFDDYIDKYVLAHWQGYMPKLFQYNIHVLLLPVIILVTVLVSSASFFCIEKPFLRLKAQFS
jgi:peptidoglycan/LPS O-acetylase OafA/YrhL